jgi:DNA polymerase-3 subunit gamma/tau
MMRPDYFKAYTFDPMAKEEGTFIVSARKYRPETWQQVIGQGAITETLHNSITQDHMAHAYLFCGPRGVGKTTCARIFAKEINRSEQHADDEDFAFNIFELDAASNNSVDDIRSLTDQVRIPPQVGQYKVYIIDEVHMLSKQAFNAFLKTLEEPPKHAIFILATTEKHKIIPTILSRCQIYDFNRISIEDIVKQLTHIAHTEEIKFEPEALHVIAQKADGAMRDALSIFDQLSSFTNQHLTYDAVLKNLHVLDYDHFFRITDGLLQQAYGEVLVIFDSILKQGFDGQHFISGLSAHFRDLLVCQVPATVKLLEVGDSVKQRYIDQASSIDAEWLIAALQLTNEADFRYRNAPNARLLVETTLLSLASLGLEKKNDSPEGEPLIAPTQKARVHAAEAPVSSPTNPPPAAPPPPVTPTITELPDQDTTLIPSKETPPHATVEGSQTLAAKRVKRAPRTVSLKLDSKAPAPSEEEATTDQSDSYAPPEHETTNDEEEPVPTNTAEEATLTLDEVWKQMCQDALDQGKSALYGILARQAPSKQLEGKTLIIQLLHEVDTEEYNQHSADILSALRNYTSDGSYGLRSVLIEGKEETKLFTPQDKFEYLAKQNPLLRKLRSDLDLDITY